MIKNNKGNKNPIQVIALTKKRTVTTKKASNHILIKYIDWRRFNYDAAETNLSVETSFQSKTSMKDSIPI